MAKSSIDVVQDSSSLSGVQNSQFIIGYSFNLSIGFQSFSLNFSRLSCLFSKSYVLKIELITIEWSF